MHCHGYRFYNPIIGSWMTRDPLCEAGGINLYNFVGNNPGNFVDPLESEINNKNLSHKETI